MRKGTQKPELVLGTAQLGLDYGILNTAGCPTDDTARALLDRAVAAGIRQFDTARAYGRSEERLGLYFGDTETPFRIITKLDPLAKLDADATPRHVEHAANNSVQKSTLYLGRDGLDTLLLHRADNLFLADGHLWKHLLALKARGVIERLGISVQSPDELARIIDLPGLEHIQLPFNILDTRWHQAGTIDMLRARPDITVHVRSIFLQGLLACADWRRWPDMPGLDRRAVAEWLTRSADDLTGGSLAALSIGYVGSLDWVDGLVIGMDRPEQVDINRRLVDAEPLDPGHLAAVLATRPAVPDAFLNPALWPPRRKAA